VEIVLKCSASSPVYISLIKCLAEVTNRRSSNPARTKKNALLGFQTEVKGESYYTLFYGRSGLEGCALSFVSRCIGSIAQSSTLCSGPFGTVPELLFEKKRLMPPLRELLVSFS
jgi:hypothetical protein